MSTGAASSIARRISRVDPNAVLAVVAVTEFMVILDASIVNVALPTIRRDVGISQQNLAWILNAYTLMFGGFLLLGGRLADRLGRRRRVHGRDRGVLERVARLRGVSVRGPACSWPGAFRGWAGRWCRRPRCRSS